MPRHRSLFLFFLSYIFFNDGVHTVIAFSGQFGQAVLGWTEASLIKVFLLVQAVGFVGALGMGWLADRFGGRRTLLVALVIWCGVIGWAYVLQSSWEYVALGVLVGLIMGGTQAIARSLFALYTPKEQAAEFFGFFAIGGKFGSILGPTLLAEVARRTGDLRSGLGSIALFFAVAFVLLWATREPAPRDPSGS
jgi:UMF1 family MFS transporter